VEQPTKIRSFLLLVEESNEREKEEHHLKQLKKG
jgi:hypothetical protein